MNIPEIVHVLGFTRNPDAMTRTCAEVERVGFKPEPYWNFPTPYVDFLVRHMPCTGIIRQNPGFLSCSLGHYAIWKTFYALGGKTLFICEDDCRFLKDKDKVHAALQNHPKDADILLLDTFFPEKGGLPVKKIYLAERAIAKGGWARLTRARSFGCYVIGERMIGKMIYFAENGTRYKKQRICDQWMDQKYLGDLKIYSAVPNLAIQQRSPEGNARNSGIQQWKYKEQHTEEQLYADW